MSTDALVTIEQPGEMALARAPEVVLAEAAKAATALKQVLEGKAKKVMFNGEQYLEFEDWQTLGRFYGVTAKIVGTEYVEYGEAHGFTAKAVALRADGMEISAAESACLTDEEKWRGRAKYKYENGVRSSDGEEPVPLFQLKSMAQTRACAKVLRNVLAWVAVLAGYRPTPAEELDGAQTAQNTPAAGNQAQAQSDGQLRVTDVLKKDGKNAQSGKAWVKWTVTLSDGRSGGTFDEKLGKLAAEAQTLGAVVEAEFDTSGKFHNLTDLRMTGKAPEAAKPEPGVSQAGPVEQAFTVAKVFEMFKQGDTVTYGITTEELGPEQYLLTTDKDAARTAIKAKKDGDRIGAKYREETKTVGDQRQVQRWVSELSVVLAKPLEAEVVTELGASEVKW